MSNQDKDIEDIEKYLGVPETNLEFNYTNQPYQASYMKGEINITVRGESKENVMRELKEMITNWQGWTGAIGTQSAQPIADANIKCPVCSSATHTKMINKKDGTTVQVYECDNTNCKTSYDFKTGQYNPGNFRTTIWPKKTY